MISQSTGEWLLVWTIRVAIACYLWRIFLGFKRQSLVNNVPARTEVSLWTIGAVSYLVHVACAFEFVHDWSHVAALDHTAQETKRFVGIGRGEGLYVNYLFTAIWLADVIRLWLANLLRSQTNRWVDVGVHTLFAFIVFNATVVFGPAIYRWLTIPAAGGLAVIWYYHR